MSPDKQTQDAIRRLAESGLKPDDVYAMSRVQRLIRTVENDPEYRQEMVDLRAIGVDDEFGRDAIIHQRIWWDIACARRLLSDLILTVGRDLIMAREMGEAHRKLVLERLEERSQAEQPFTIEQIINAIEDEHNDGFPLT